MRGVIAAVVVVGAVALAAVLATSGVFNSPPSPLASPSVRPTASSNGPSPTFPTARPSATPTDNSVVASGVVVPLRSADLATRVSGVVAAIYVHEESHAEANQLLLKLDQSTYQAAINTAQDVIDRATAAEELAQLQVEQLPADATPGEIESAQAQLRLAQAELELARTKLSEAQTALLQTEVRAPFAGTIAEVDVETGEQALAGQTVMTIGDISGWLIETTDLSELEVVRLAVGDRATVTFDALPELTIDGTVDRIQVRGASDDGGVVFAVAIDPTTITPSFDGACPPQCTSSRAVKGGFGWLRRSWQRERRGYAGRDRSAVGGTVDDTLTGSAASGRDWRRAALTFALTLGAIVLFVAAFAAGYDGIHNGKVLPGVQVGSVPVGGLDPASAEAKIRAALPDPSAGQLTVTLGDKVATIPYSQIERDYDMKAMLGGAVGVGRQGIVEDCAPWPTAPRSSHQFPGTTTR